MTADVSASLHEPTTGLQILVVEDNAAYAKSTAYLLRIDGHDVTVADDGLIALDCIQAHEPDVVFIDIGLPGIDGWELAKRIKQRGARKEPLLVAITGFGSEEDRQRSEACGIDLHLQKPVDPELLRGMLKRFQRVIG